MILSSFAENGHIYTLISAYVFFEIDTIITAGYYLKLPFLNASRKIMII